MKTSFDNSQTVNMLMGEKNYFALQKKEVNKLPIL